MDTSQCSLKSDIKQLKRAVCSGNDELFEEVVSMIDTQNNEHMLLHSMLLHYAITIPNRERFIEPLIQLGVPITVCNSKGYSVLDIAVQLNKHDTLSRLCNVYASTIVSLLTNKLLHNVLKQANSNTLDVILPLYNIESLNYAMWKVYPIESLRKLLTVCDITFINNNCTDILYKYIEQCKDNGCIMLLLELPNIKLCDTVLNNVIVKDKVDIVKMMLMIKQPTNITSVVFRHCKSVEMVELLIQYVDPNQRFNRYDNRSSELITPLEHFIKRCRFDICIFLIKNGVELKGDEIVHLMDTWHNTSNDNGKLLFDILLDSGIDVNVEINMWGYKTTALMEAFSTNINAGMMYYIERLIACGANPYFCNGEYTILSRAVVYGTTQYTKYLFKNYMDLINVESVITPLYIACTNGHNAVINVLLQHGATDTVDVNGNDIMMKCILNWNMYNRGETKFHLISQRNIYKLYSLGVASIYNRNTVTGKTVIDMCIEYNYINILKSLLNIVM